MEYHIFWRQTLITNAGNPGPEPAFASINQTTAQDGMRFFYHTETLD